MTRVQFLIFGAVFATFLFKESYAAGCNIAGWFGKNGCKYLCHCFEDATCDLTTGKCPGKCDENWFGPACQFRAAEFNTTENLDWLTDKDDTTCSSNTNDPLAINLNLETPQPLTWIRMLANNLGDASMPEVRYRKKDSVSFEKCSGALQVDDTVVDIYCPTSDVVDVVVVSISEGGQLCSVYISSGRNVALKQKTYQTSTFSPWYHTKAVDGYPGRPNDDFDLKAHCSHTKSSDSRGFWRVYFDDHTVEINKVIVYNRRNPARSNCCENRLIGFNMRLQIEENIIFNYTDPGPNAMDIYTIVPTTTIMGVNRIHIQKSAVSTILTLCEVIVYGEQPCPLGKFGLSCDRDCNCKNGGSCFVSTGGCSTGCKIGYTGEDCWQECPIGTFGDRCLQKCAETCFGEDNACNHETGVCTNQCDAGYQNPYCDAICDVRRWGYYCANTCSDNCKGDGKTCNHVNGTCDEGCEPGYLEPVCIEKCPNGFYGDGCNTNCSATCSSPDNDCDHVTGKCTYGCDPGYQDIRCDKNCDGGTYGASCAKNCSENCAGIGTCNHIHGTCSEGCEPGYLEPLCTDKCPGGTYGVGCVNCSSNCAGEHNACYHVTGECELGCEVGYQPPMCVKECPTSTYGQDCSERCNSTCHNRECDPINGKCVKCVDGYLGEYCDQECPIYTFGQDCMSNCSANCEGQMCSHLTGVCVSCIDGMTGKFCDLVSSGQGGGAAGGDSSSSGSMIGVIIGAVVGVLLVGTVVGFLMWRRRRKEVKKPLVDAEKTKEEPLGLELAQDLCHDEDAISIDAEADKKENVYGNILTGNTPVPVSELMAYIEKHESDKYLKEQFDSIPMENSYPRTCGLASKNVKKNRYKNIVPYDTSRVKLEVDNTSSSDYFNASYIKGYGDNTGFIASQAPNDLVLNDFIRMIWEQQVDRVVMLTNLTELGKKKCTMYWPINGEETFGEISVKLLTTQVYAEFTIRRLSFSKKGESNRSVTQFHYTAWPDKSVPDSPWGLADFYQKVVAEPETGSMLVHCSAGVGRTGTFIALCHLVQEANATGQMDFRQMLWRLRQDRMSMIQTFPQYVFVHRAALVAYLTAEKVTKDSDLDTELNAVDYEREFKIVNEVCVENVAAVPRDKNDAVYENSKETVNKRKNRFSNILPNDTYRPGLNVEENGNVYINAVLVPSVKRDRQDIITQLPLPSTVSDFWNLVLQYDVGLIVAFQAESSDSDETIADFLLINENGTAQNQQFAIEKSVTKDSDLWVELSLAVTRQEVSKKKIKCPRNVKCLMCKDATLDPKSALDFQRQIKSIKPEEPSRILYMCRNGAEHSGMACVQSIILERFETDQCVNIPLVVGAIKAIRPQVIPTVDQYKCLYDVLRLSKAPSAPNVGPSAIAEDDTTTSVYGNIGNTVECLNNVYGNIGDTGVRSNVETEARAGVNTLASQPSPATDEESEKL